MQRTRRNRDKLKMIEHLLDAVARYPNMTISRQASIAGIPLAPAKIILKSLEEKGFVKQAPNYNKKISYRITSNGQKLLQDITRCYQAIAEPKICIAKAII